MKKFFNYLCLAAIGATTLVACSKSDITEDLPTIPETPVTVKKVSFSAKSANPGTKTVYGEKTSEGYPTIWTTKQNVSIAMNYGSVVSAAVTPSTDGKTATFNATISSTGSAPYVFYALSPAVAANSWNSENSSVTVNFPASQTPTMASVDEAAHIMAAKSASYTEFPAETDPVSLSFAHIAAYGKFMLKNFPENVTINSIDLTADENIVGTVDYFPANGTLTDKSASKTLTINASAISAESNASKVFWFAVKPVNFEGKNLMVVVHTSGGDYIRNINFPTGKGNFVAGQVAAFNINMNGIVPATTKTATIQFGGGTGSTKINSSSVIGNDSQGNTWIITTTGNPYYDQESNYSLIGADGTEANSITFTTTLPQASVIKSLSIKLKADNDKAVGEVNEVKLFVENIKIGSGYVPSSYNPVTISATPDHASGKDLKITITGIDGGIQAYNVSVTYEN